MKYFLEANKKLMQILFQSTMKLKIGSIIIYIGYWVRNINKRKKNQNQNQNQNKYNYNLNK
jgi:hypothetical protein